AAQGVGALGLDELAEKLVVGLEAAEHRQAHAGVADHFDLVVDETPEKRAVRRKPELLADGAVQLVDFPCYQTPKPSGAPFLLTGEHALLNLRQNRLVPERKLSAGLEVDVAGEGDPSAKRAPIDHAVSMFDEVRVGRLEKHLDFVSGEDAWPIKGHHVAAIGRGGG